MPRTQIRQARLVGTAVVTGSAAAWTLTGNVTTLTYSNFVAASGSIYTVTGEAIAPSTNVPGFKFASLEAGDYRIEYEGEIDGQNAGYQYYFRFSDGTNGTREQVGLNCPIIGASINCVSGTLNYTTAQTNVTFQLQCKEVNGGGPTSPTVQNTSTRNGTFRLWFFPTTT